MVEAELCLLFILNIKNIDAQIELRHDGGLELPDHAALLVRVGVRGGVLDLGLLLVHEAEDGVGDETLHPRPLVAPPGEVQPTLTAPAIFKYNISLSKLCGFHLDLFMMVVICFSNDRSLL